MPILGSEHKAVRPIYLGSVDFASTGIRARIGTVPVNAVKGAAEGFWCIGFSVFATAALGSGTAVTISGLRADGTTFMSAVVPIGTTASGTWRHLPTNVVVPIGGSLVFNVTGAGGTGAAGLVTLYVVSHEADSSAPLPKV